jgi:hypothetical protein
MIVIDRKLGHCILLHKFQCSFINILSSYHCYLEYISIINIDLTNYG